MVVESHKSAIVDIVQFLTGHAPGRIRSIPQGVMTHKYEVRVQDRKFLVRIYPKGREDVVVFEPDVIRKCHNLKIKVPKVLVDSRSGPKCEFNYMVYEFVEGQTLLSYLSGDCQKHLYAICEEVVEAIAEMAKIKIDGFGELLTKDKGSELLWGDFLENSCQTGLCSAQGLLLDSEEALHKIEKACKDLINRSTCVESSLVYSDLRPENIIVTQDFKLAAIVDFEGVLSGDPLLSLGYCYAACGDDLFFRTMEKCWVEKFGSVDQGQIYCYAILRLLRIARHLNEPLPTGEKRMPIKESFPGFYKSLSHI